MSHDYGGRGVVLSAPQVSQNGSLSSPVTQTGNGQGSSLPARYQHASHTDPKEALSKLDIHINQFSKWEKNLSARVKDLQQRSLELKTTQDVLEPCLNNRSVLSLQGKMDLPQGFGSQGLRSDPLIDASITTILRARGEVTLAATAIAHEVEHFVEAVTTNMIWLKDHPVVAEGQTIVRDLEVGEINQMDLSRLAKWAKNFDRLVRAEGAALAYLDHISKDPAGGELTKTVAIGALVFKEYIENGTGRAILSDPAVFKTISSKTRSETIAGVKRSLEPYEKTVLAGKIVELAVVEHKRLSAEIEEAVTNINQEADLGFQVTNAEIKQLRQECGAGPTGEARFSNLVALIAEFKSIGVEAELLAIVQQKPEYLDSSRMPNHWIKSIREAQAELKGFEPFFPEPLSKVPERLLRSETALSFEVERLKVILQDPDSLKVELAARLEGAIAGVLKTVPNVSLPEQVAKSLRQLYFTPDGQLIIPSSVSRDQFNQSELANTYSPGTIPRLLASLSKGSIVTQDTRSVSLELSEKSPLAPVIERMRSVLGERERAGGSEPAPVTARDELLKQLNRVIIALEFVKLKDVILKTPHVEKRPGSQSIMAKFYNVFAAERTKLIIEVQQKQRGAKLNVQKREQAYARLLRDRVLKTELEALKKIAVQVSQDEQIPELVEFIRLFENSEKKLSGKKEDDIKALELTKKLLETLELPVS